uniref:deleted in malignant brain tumors 1 protein-like isoform X2 n=1 Tax=Myxine glutinosa TaxID=7769 RepID=UPI00358EFF64
MLLEALALKMHSTFFILLSMCLYAANIGATSPAAWYTTTRPTITMPAAMSVRLVGGRGRCEGRVEVFYRGSWGTVCDDAWSVTDANVVCRQLGCGSARSSPCCAAFGRGNGSILMDNVQCTGSESYLSHCPHQGWHSHNCVHAEDASVVCQAVASYTTTRPTTTMPAAMSVRLVGGRGRCEGRVEVFYRGSWGTVCDDAWSVTDANVVCRQLGCGSARSSPCCAAFGRGSGSILMDNVQCTGSESYLSHCPHQGWHSHNCGHGEDASVVCQAVASYTTTRPTTTMPAAMSVRLVGGRGRCEGRVEVFYRGSWGTVCDDAWSVTDANVVCRQLGCGSARSSPCCAAFGRGNGSILMDNVQCTGSESYLSHCPHQGWHSHNCVHGEDASVVCQAVASYTTTRPTTTMPAAMSVRLVGGRGRCEGRVEVFYRGSWGTVCDDAWSVTDANVVCRQLGCGSARSSPCCAAFGRGNGSILMDNVQCTGSESYLSHCQHQGWHSHNCGHHEDASVVCQAAASYTTTRPTTTMPAAMSVRLVGGRGRCEGRVEVFFRGSWGTVCDDAWSVTDANVVCRQLGCGSARSSPCCAAFGRGNGSILMDNVQCTGSESYLSHCQHQGWHSHNCGHGEDASVVCQAAASYTTTRPTTTMPAAMSVRLVGGRGRCEGRVEVFYRGSWGTVCDDAWSVTDANVVCRQLGCGSARSSPCCAAFGRGNGSILMDNVQCTGSESYLSHCPHQGWHSHNCVHAEDASVVCQAVAWYTTTRPTTTMPAELPVRLVGGEDRCEGRVEVFYQGSWGTVCDDFWDNNDAQVVCRQLDCGSPMTAASPVDFGQGRGSIWMDNVFCNGSETHLSQCRHNGWGTHNCVHDEDATVLCDGQGDNIILTCNDDYMEISIRGAYIDHVGYTGNNIHLNDPSCRGQRVGRRLSLQTPLRSCGTTTENNGHEVVHKNIVWARKEHKIIRLPVHCVSNGQGVMNAVLGLLTEYPSWNPIEPILRGNDNDQWNRGEQ